MSTYKKKKDTDRTGLEVMLQAVIVVRERESSIRNFSNG
jgi:hypothetical protein